jgi:hypothetical protein
MRDVVRKLRERIAAGKAEEKEWERNNPGVDL